MKGQVNLLYFRFINACVEGWGAVKNVYRSPANQIRKSYLKKYILVSIIGMLPLVIDLYSDYIITDKSIMTLIKEYAIKGSFIWTFITIGLCAIMDGNFFWSQQGKNNLTAPNKGVYNAICIFTAGQIICYIVLSRTPKIHVNKVNCVAYISIGLAIITFVLCFAYQISLATCSYNYETYLDPASAKEGDETYAK